MTEKTKVEYFSDDSLFMITHTKNGKRHSIKGPAQSEWWRTGQMATRSYYVNDRLHRVDGPAYIQWHQDGTLWHEDYYLNGEKQND
jgi:hypothetical protein